MSGLFAPRARWWRALASAVAFALLAFCGHGCVIAHSSANASPELRWWLFSNYGAKRICPELRRQGIGLRLQDTGPAVGRFFPTQCTTQIDDRSRTITVGFGGTGYGYAPVSGRVGFALDTVVQYRPDFRLTSRGTYVWGVFNRTIRSPSFRILYVDNPLANVMGGPVSGIGAMFGRQMVQGELTRGFTVVHTETGNSFALGLVHPPRKPFTPFHVTSKTAFTYANEKIAVHPGQRDYLGPFYILGSDQHLRLQLVLQGQPVDVMVVDRSTGDRWRHAYQTSARLGPPPGPVLAGSPLTPGRPMQVSYRLPVGSYYVVIDNTAFAGVVRPPPLGSLLGGAANVSYTVQLAE